MVCSINNWRWDGREPMSPASAGTRTGWGLLAEAISVAIATFIAFSNTRRGGLCAAQITVFGESARSVSTCMHMVMPSR